MAQCVEEEKMRVCIDLDQHHNARGDNGYEADDVHDPEAVEDDVAWAGQRLGRERHSVGFFGGLGLCVLQLGGDDLDAFAFERYVHEPEVLLSVSMPVIIGVCSYFSDGYRRKNMWYYLVTVQQLDVRL